MPTKDFITNPFGTGAPKLTPHLIKDADGDMLPGLGRLVALAIDDKWKALAGAPGEPRVPTDRGLIAVGTGFFREYANGRIYDERNLGAFWVHGAILDKYIQLGGPGSWLGWPTSDEEEFAEGRASRFQNGAIYWWPDTGAFDMGDVVVRYAGLFCFGESNELSAHDEPYVVLGSIPTLNEQTLTTRSRIYEDVDAGDSREDDIELYRGAPFGLQLSATVFEHDLQDPDKYKETIAAAVEQASRAAALGLAQIPYVGSFVAPVGAALLKAIGPDLVDGINNLVGGKDDFIDSRSFFVSPKDMVRLARAERQNQRGILWHLDSPLITDGDASYKVYVSIAAL